MRVLFVLRSLNPGTHAQKNLAWKYREKQKVAMKRECIRLASGNRIKSRLKMNFIKPQQATPIVDHFWRLYISYTKVGAVMFQLDNRFY